MVLYASDHLARFEDDLDGLSTTLLHMITYLDDWGAWHWNLRWVGVFTAILLGCIRITLQKRGGVDWYALVHALMSGLGAASCVYLNMVASVPLTGSSEPLRSCLCEGPLTSLHRILPAITMGYALFDLLDGLTLGWDFLSHGIATLAIMAFFCEVEAPNVITPMLLMELSTIFLTVVRAKFFSPFVAAVNQALFVLSFFVFRGIVAPLLWGQIMMTMYTQSSTPQYKECFPVYVFPVSLVFGMFYNILNAYWFGKIIRKARRKWMGQEKVHDKNDFKDE